MKRIYLDYAATTPVDPEVLRAMTPYFSEKFGNAGSLHSFGQDAIAALDRSPETIAEAIGADFRHIVFTASATEANNLALRGAVKKFRETRRATPRIIISTLEHESVMETARDLERDGVEVVYVSAGAVKENLTPETAIVSIIYAQNEIGTLAPISEIAAVIKAFRGKNAYPLLHTDAAQAFQFLDCDVNTQGVDLMTLSSHKLYGPKGAGALYVRDLTALSPDTTGGGQEFGLRSGTENVPAIAGFAKAVELAAAAREKESKRIGKLRDRLWEEIKKIAPKAEINGPQDAAGKLPNILNIYFPGHAAQDLLTKFDLNGLAASSGSACRSRAMESSYVIETLGHSKERAKSSIRFSVGRPTTEEEINETFSRLSRIMK